MTLKAHMEECLELYKPQDPASLCKTDKERVYKRILSFSKEFISRFLM
jgi:hypothetical protein